MSALLFYMYIVHYDLFIILYVHVYVLLFLEAFPCGLHVYELRHIHLYTFIHVHVCYIPVL